jgi:hypothetical protein
MDFRVIFQVKSLNPFIIVFDSLPKLWLAILIVEVSPSKLRQWKRNR